MPNLGDIADAEVIEGSVSVGDTIDIDTPLIVVETDKASMDIPSTLAGKVIQVASSIGDKVKDGDQLVLVSVSESSSESVSSSTTTMAFINPSLETQLSVVRLFVP